VACSSSSRIAPAATAATAPGVSSTPRPPRTARCASTSIRPTTRHAHSPLSPRARCRRR
jgi:hypothetical protein